jgi:hypothetical protein
MLDFKAKPNLSPLAVEATPPQRFAGGGPLGAGPMKTRST